MTCAAAKKVSATLVFPITFVHFAMSAVWAEEAFAASAIARASLSDACDISAVAVEMESPMSRAHSACSSAVAAAIDAFRMLSWPSRRTRLTWSTAFCRLAAVSGLIIFMGQILVARTSEPIFSGELLWILRKDYTLRASDRFPAAWADLEQAAREKRGDFEERGWKERSGCELHRRGARRVDCGVSLTADMVGILLKQLDLLLDARDSGRTLTDTGLRRD